MIAALAEGQHGVVSRRQLLAAGVSAKAIEVRVGRGSLLSLHRGVYAVGHRRLRREGYWLAAVLAVGQGAVLSHRQAAALHGFRPANGSTIDVSTKRDRGGLAGIQIHRTRVLGTEEITEIDGIPVTTVSRTFVDLAGLIPRDHLAKALREADRMQLLDVRGIERALARVLRRTGVGHQRMREALAEYAPLAQHRTRSALEDDFLRLVHRAGLPLPQTNVLLHGFEVDALWRARRLVVELDGRAFHRDRHAFQRDRERDRALALSGHTVLRYTYEDVVKRGARVVAELRAALAP